MASNRELFEAWLGEMNAAIARFVEATPPEIRIRLDGSDMSLDVLEQWLLRKYANPQEAAAAKEKLFVDGAARYVGEVFRRHTSSSWRLELDNTKDAFYGIPTLGGGSLRTHFCPLAAITASADRRTGQYFSTILHNVRQDQKGVH